MDVSISITTTSFDFLTSAVVIYIATTTITIINSAVFIATTTLAISTTNVETINIRRIKAQRLLH